MRRSKFARTQRYGPGPSRLSASALSGRARFLRRAFRGPARMDEEAIAAGVAASRTAIPRAILPYGARGMSTNVHKYARWRDTRAVADGGVDPLGISCNFGATGWVGLGINFEYHDVSHNAELSTLYDAYRIDKVELWFDYSPDSAGSSSTSYLSRFPKLWIKRDYNDSNNPTLTDLEQSNQTQVLRFTSDHTTLGPYFIKPAAQLGAVDAAAAIIPTVSTWSPWLRTAHPRIEHYGLKMVAQGLPTTDMGSITIRVRYHLTMKNVR